MKQMALFWQFHHHCCEIPDYNFERTKFHYYVGSRNWKLYPLTLALHKKYFPKCSFRKYYRDMKYHRDRFSRSGFLFFFPHFGELQKRYLDI